MSVAGLSWEGHRGHGDYRGACFDNPSETLVINAYGNNLDIGFPVILSLSNYKLSVGWSLVGGEWNFHLAIYDFDRVYTSSTTLSNLRSNPSQARVNLSNWQEIQGLAGADGDITLVKWYYDDAQEALKLLILEKFLRSGSYELDTYKTTYNNSSKAYTAVKTDKYTVGSNDFDSSNIHIFISDALFTLNSGATLIFEQKNILDFNLGGNYLFGDGTGSKKATLAADVLDDPILVKKNATQFYIMYFNNDKLYIYLYSRGISVPTSVALQDFPGEIIQKLIVKFGALFIVTDKNIYVEDISSRSLISVVPTSSGSNFQINRDGDGKIYAMSNGLQCSIDGNCNNALRIYLDTGCSAMSKLDGIGLHLNVVYKSFEH
ncbi:hypothetical protein fh0823_18230 [Francisella halioticida]|uniref:hypothetical protein n=1 Tax=Francisella halioticida TaxID=549298 RepID=UPI001AF1E588|nr:hypothetical protein [Francisella halioticida]BCD91684.1 hypothetical protein fh0823_18230 [Francisella halioticida]